MQHWSSASPATSSKKAHQVAERFQLQTSADCTPPPHAKASELLHWNEEWKIK
jgi:hypothetical protein